MTMQPAPTDGAGDAHCGCHRCEWYNNAGYGYWTLLEGEIDGSPVEAHYCPSCGRPLGFDAEGNPVVGHSPAHIERAMDHLRQLTVSDMPPTVDGLHFWPWCLSSIVDEVLAATKEVPDE